jgi:hypothetical protein
LALFEETSFFYPDKTTGLPVSQVFLLFRHPETFYPMLLKIKFLSGHQE